MHVRMYVHVCKYVNSDYNILCTRYIIVYMQAVDGRYRAFDTSICVFVCAKYARVCMYACLSFCVCVYVCMYVRK